jgi:23S rRNA A2030 N6-methylase RlmJ
MSVPGTSLQPSWVIWLRDGRYSYAWGATAEEAQRNYLKEWEQGIARVVSAAEHPNQLPPRLYVPTVNAVLRGMESTSSLPALYDTAGKRNSVE